MIQIQRVTVIPDFMQMRFRSPQAAAGGFTPADVPQSEADALIWLYNNTTGASWTNKAGWLIDTTVNNWYGVTVTGGHVTDLVLSSNNLNGNIGSWAVDDLPLTGATGLRLNTNASLSGNISGWTLPASLAVLLLNDTSVSGDISSWTLPASLAHLRLHGTSVSGNISGWTLPASLSALLLNDTSVSGDISSWTLPASLAILYLDSTSVSGDISGWTLPASLFALRLDNTSVSGTPNIASNTAMRQYYYHTCGLSQANVDAILLSVYNRRAAFTYATPALQVGGTNAAPSGVYQDGDPPTTGKEYAFEIVNDPETEGFKKWTVTFAA